MSTTTPRSPSSDYAQQDLAADPSEGAFTVTGQIAGGLPPFPALVIFAARTVQIIIPNAGGSPGVGTLLPIAPGSFVVEARRFLYNLEIPPTQLSREETSGSIQFSEDFNQFKATVETVVFDVIPGTGGELGRFQTTLSGQRILPPERKQV